MTNNGVSVGVYSDLGIMRGIKIRVWNFLNGDTGLVISNTISTKGKIIKVVPSYFCGGVYLALRDT